MRGVGTNLHAVVMRAASVSVPSLVTPGRSAPPPRLGSGSAPRPRDPSGQSFLQRTLLVDAKTCLYCDPFPNLLSLPRPLSLWSFPSQMGFRRPPFSTDFIFQFPNHICLPALSKLCQRREISSWLVSTRTPSLSTQVPSISWISGLCRRQ